MGARGEMSYVAMWWRRLLHTALLAQCLLLPDGPDADESAYQSRSSRVVVIIIFVRIILIIGVFFGLVVFRIRHLVSLPIPAAQAG